MISQTYSNRWLGVPGEETRRVQAFRPEFDLRQFSDLPKWKGILSEYAAMCVAKPKTPERLDLHKLVRRYMSEQSEIIVDLRNRWTRDLETWDAAVAARRDLIPDRVGEKAVTETVAVQLRGEETIKTLYISETLLGDIRHLEQDNRPLVNLDKLELRL